jgi:hypothetical protein
MTTPSLAMDVTPTADGWEVTAPWLSAPVRAPTWYEAYYLAMAALSLSRR